MQSLRQQVDQIDRKMLQQLQQRIKLSGQIGEMKRRHGAVVYVPERERELVARLTRLGKGKPPARVIAALYREILSSSRAAQGQAPIGLLQTSAPTILPASRACFGACDRFEPRKKWAQIADGLQSGELSLALLTGDDLAHVLQTPRWRNGFLDRLTVVGDFPPVAEGRVLPGKRIFIVTPRRDPAATEADRILILIECKSTLNAIKSLLHMMPNLPAHTEQLPCGASKTALVRLTLDKSTDGVQVTNRLREAGAATGHRVSILGFYPGTEDHGG
jgi:chorismate mutase